MTTRTRWTPPSSAMTTSPMRTSCKCPNVLNFIFLLSVWQSLRAHCAVTAAGIFQICFAQSLHLNRFQTCLKLMQKLGHVICVFCVIRVIDIGVCCSSQAICSTDTVALSVQLRKRKGQHLDPIKVETTCLSTTLVCKMKVYR